jgi:hypothetical protein
LIVLKTITPNIFYTQDLDLVMNDQIVQHPWEQNPFQSLLNTNNPMDATQLDVVVYMVSYLPLDMIDGKGWLAHDANILSSTRQVNIAEHVLEVLQGEMGVMKTQLREVTSEHNALHEELASCQTKCLGLEQDVIYTIKC